jgi:RimJ/RimL family protein N-acetyltransferase
MATSRAEPVARLEPLRPRDEPALRELFEANDVPQVTRWFDPFPLTAATARSLARYDGPDLYWGVWRGEQLLGLAMVRGWDGGHPQRAYGILVDRRWSGHGLGRAATASALDELRRRGETLVRARVHADNARSLDLFVRSGFRELERRDGRVLLECALG